MSRTRRTYELTKEMSDALATDPVEYIAKWWNENATDDEKKAADERGATPSGAFAFVESVARKAKKSNSSCLPDALTFELAAIFMRNGADGDEFVTPDELKRREAEEAERKAKAERRKAEAEAKEAERKASLTPEQREEEERIERERLAKAAEEEAKRKAAQEAREAKRARIERAKAIAKEMADRQLEFNFGD